MASGTQIGCCWQPQSTPWHRLTRFVSKRGIATRLLVKPEDITESQRWPSAILVVGKGFSRFVSYAGLPPIAGVAPPNGVDFHYWRKRWKKKQAPDFWPEFYAEHFKDTHWVDELSVPATVAAAVIRVMLPEKVCWLQEVYKEQKYVLETF